MRFKQFSLGPLRWPLASGSTSNSRPVFAVGFLTVLGLVGCHTPKEQALDGFADSCYAVDSPEVKRFCDCMMRRLDSEISADVFNHSDNDPIALMRAFGGVVSQLTPQCKAEADPSSISSSATETQEVVPETPSPAPTPRSTTTDDAAPGESAPSSEAIESAGSDADGWLMLQQKIRTAPQAFVKSCFEGYIESARELGGMSREEALAAQPDLEKNCQNRLTDLKHCMTLDAEAGERCYRAYSQDWE